MATLLCFPINQVGNNTTASASTISVAATSVSTPITVGNNVLVRIVATAPINVRFGPSSLTVATANDVYIPANVIDTHDMGSNLNTIVIFNPGASAVSVNVSLLSRT